MEAALRIAPHLAYQPVHPEISKMSDERVRALEEEVHGHADRALTALAERDATAVELKTVKEELTLLRASEDKFKQEIIALRTRARSVQQNKDYSSMSVDEVKQQRQLITEELRKLDQALRSMREGPASQAGLAGMLNPDFAPKPPQAPPPPAPTSPS